MTIEHTGGHPNPELRAAYLRALASAPAPREDDGQDRAVSEPAKELATA
jgi:hypothetical protein